MPLQKSNYSISETSIHWAIVAAFGAIVAFFHAKHPVAYLHLVSEDWHGEYATALCFLVLAACFARLAFRGTDSRRFLWWMIAAGGFFVGMEELSWGQRILGISTPGPLKDANLQGEITLHNLVFLPKLHEIAGALFAAWAIASVTRLRGLFHRVGIPAVPLPLVPWFLATAYLFIVYPLVKSDELGEMFLGLGMALLGLFASVKAVRPRLISTLILLIVVGLAAESLTHAYNGGLGYRLRTAAERDFAKRGLFAQSEQLFAYIYAHPEHMKDDTHLIHANLLVERGELEEALPHLQTALERVRKKRAAGPHGTTKKQRDRSLANDLRTEGQILLHLEKSQGQDRDGTQASETSEAHVVLARSISMDEIALDQPEIDPKERAERLWSLAQTELARGHRLDAQTRFEEALKASPSAQLRNKITRRGKSLGLTESSR